MLTKRRFEGAVRGAQGAGLIGSVEVSAWVELFPRAVILTIATPARAGASHVW